MSTTTYSSFAVVGGLSGGATGAQIGVVFANALLDKGLKVKVLGRSSTTGSDTAKDLSSRGAQIIGVDYSSESELKDALVGVDVVISTLSGPGFEFQKGLAKAAKEAGVGLFVPSEFGNNTLTQSPSSPLYGKYSLHAYLKDELQLPYALIFTGGFADWGKVFLGVNDKGDEITIVGDGEREASFTRIEDVGRWIAHVFSTTEPSKLANSSLPIEGSRHTLNSLAKHYQSLHPTRSIKITHTSIEDAKARWEKEHDFLAWLKAEWAEGRGVVAERGEEVGRKFWAEWGAVDVKDLLK